MIRNHNLHNARFGQLFTMLVYIPGALHLIVTPLVLLSLFVLIFVHATGRWPRATTRDAFLLLCGAAFCWLATPAPGQAFFYRPVTTNYVYTFALSLLYFLPFRRGAVIAGKLRVTALSCLLFATGLAVGLFNEHTGPVAILVAAGYAFVAARRRRLADFAWMASGTVGLLVGYRYLFFAPGLSKRVGHVGKQTVLDTVLLRGFGGNLELIGNALGYVAPLAGAVCIILVVVASRRSLGALTSEASKLRLRAMALYVLLAVLIVGISLAAPRSHYRLAIAPSLLLVVAALGAVELVSGDRVVQTVIGVAALSVHLVFAYAFLGTYSEFHTDEQARIALAQGTRSDQILYVPRMRHPARTPMFYGDTLPTDKRHRYRMALLYDIAEVRIGAPHRIHASKRPPVIKRRPRAR